MKRSNPLLDELLTGAEVAGFRESSLTHTLAAARRKRRALLCRTAAVALLPVLLMVAVVVQRLDYRSGLTDPAPTARIDAYQPSMQATSIEFISDEDLLGLFPDQSFALIGSEGRQELIFLEPAHKDLGMGSPPWETEGSL